MANVEIEARGYTGNYALVNGTTSEDVSKLDILSAAMMIGSKGPWQLNKQGQRGVISALLKGLYTTLYLSDSNGDMRLHDNFVALDGSEKSAISYWLGMVFCKLVAERKLNIPWLLHVDNLVKDGTIKLQAGSKKRGDLVGRDVKGRWHVLEAKGRSGDIDQELIDEAKDQASHVTEVNGKPPETTSACISRLNKRPISILLDDPVNDDLSDMTTWKIDDSGFFLTYYNPIVTFLGKEKTTKKEFLGVEFVVAEREFLGTKLRIGLLPDILESPSSAMKAISEMNMTDSESRHDKLSIGPDGVLLTYDSMNGASGQ